MVWAEWLTDPADNNDNAVRQTYHHPRVRNQGELGLGQGGNLALNRPILAASQENASLGPAAAVDGNPATRWSSAWADPQ